MGTLTDTAKTAILFGRKIGALQEDMTLKVPFNSIDFTVSRHNDDELKVDIYLVMDGGRLIFDTIYARMGDVIHFNGILGYTKITLS